MVSLLIVGIGGFLGANARYLVGGWLAERLGVAFPYGTLLINVSGSFIIGLFLSLITERLAVHPAVRLFFAIGFLGAYTTFSTFTLESLSLVQGGESRAALRNVAGSAALGLAAAAAGWALASL